MKKIHFFIIGTIIAAQTLYAQDAQTDKDKRADHIRLEASVDKSLITIGEKIHYIISLIAPIDSEISFPASIADFGGFALVDFEESKPRKISNELLEYKNSYILDTYTVGSYIIPKQKVEIKWRDGFARELTTPEIFVTVKSLLEGGKSEDIRDIKGALGIAGDNKAILIALLSILAGLTLILIIKKFSKKKPKPRIIYPAHIIALKELERIEKMGHVNRGEYKEYYYLLSITMRTYLENRYALKAPEQTTEEFFESLTDNPVLGSREIDMLVDFLQSCDLVKYAKLTPRGDDVGAMMEKARFFIEETKDVSRADKKRAGKLIEV